MSEPTSGDELLASIKPKLRVIRTQVCLQPDLLEQWEDLSSELAEAQESAGGGRMNGPEVKTAKSLQRKLDDLEAVIDEVSPWFTYKAMPTKEYQALTAQHPPREDNQIDMFAGHDRDAVVSELVRKCLVGVAKQEHDDPMPVSDQAWADLLPNIAPSQWAVLRDTALEVNGGAVTPPKSQRASLRLSPPATDSA